MRTVADFTAWKRWQQKKMELRPDETWDLGSITEFKSYASFRFRSQSFISHVHVDIVYKI